MILMRHAESEFNVVYNATGADPGITDPRLTETGRRQARAAARTLAAHPVRRVVTSPYRRALETAEIVATTLDLAVTVEPLVRERRVFTCDTGTPRSVLTASWPRLDFDHLEEQWWTSAIETDDDVAARCVRFRRLAGTWRDWRDVLVISHWGFILALTGRTAHNGELLPFDPT
ncbi:MAG: histidine phosphatase family protein [Alphaproteobacteria bacterium]